MISIGADRDTVDSSEDRMDFERNTVTFVYLRRPSDRLGTTGTKER